MARLGTLAQFNLNHFDLRRQGILNKALSAEGAVFIAATKITRTNFPNQIATMLTVIPRDRPFTGVMREATLLGTQVQRHDGIGTQGTKTHGRDIEQTDVIGVLALRAAHMHFKVMRWNDRRADGMG